MTAGVRETQPAVVRVEGLSLGLRTGERVVEDVSFAVQPGEILGLVGESGSGKTTTALALLGYTRPGIVVRSGRVEVGGEAILGRDERALRSLRGRVVSYVPQDPGGALNPSLRIGDAILDVLRAHRSGESSQDSVRAALASVELGADPAFVRRYPHQLSGGQQQRVAIAMACVCEPPVAVLDEPTTGPRRAHAGPHPHRAPAAARRAGHGDGLRLARPRRRREDGRPDRRHVRRTRRRGCARRQRHPAPATPVHARAGRGDPRLPASARPARHPRASRSASASGPTAARSHRAAASPSRAARRAFPCSRSRLRATPCAAGAATRSLRRRCSRSMRAHTRARRSCRRCSTSAGSRRATAAVAARFPSCATSAFAIEPGSCVALVGESGSGKTTIGRCIAGLHEPSAGADLVRREAAGRRRALAPPGRAPAHPDRLPEPVRVAQPAPPRRRLDRASAARAARALPQGRGRRGGRAARARAAAEARREAVPDGALRRRAPAGRDRPRAGAEARPADLRRGHVRARRVGAGRRARALAGAAARRCS